MKNETEIDYQCARCRGVFSAPSKAFNGFFQALKIAAKDGRVRVEPCCLDCFMHFIPLEEQK